MVDMVELQKIIYQNKVNKGFNVTDICMEFCYTSGELSEAFDAYIKKKDDLGEELADVIIYILGLAEILNINLEDEVLKKINKNAKRIYTQKSGINQRLSGD